MTQTSLATVVDLAPAPTPDRILRAGFAFAAPRILLAAVELGLHTLPGGRKLTAEQLGATSRPTASRTACAPRPATSCGTRCRVRTCSRSA